MIKHDPKQLEARIQAYRDGIAALVGGMDAEIHALKEKRSEAIHAYAAGRRTFADGLLFSATARCKCGAGLCYREGDPKADAWDCSAGVAAELAGNTAFPFVEHQAFPFAFYEIKSEAQPSACGSTTRTEPVEFGP